MKKIAGIAALFQDLMNAKMLCYNAAGVNVDWFSHSVNSRMLCRLGSVGKCAACGGFGKAENEPRMRRFAEHSD